MVITTKAIREKAYSLRGCLANLKQTGGRRRYDHDDEDSLPMDDLFMSDEAKLLSSKAWRSMGNKTQVFTSPKNSLIRTRLTHVTEVVAVSVVTSELLGLNTNLVRAGAIGHDIGHVPLGHQGEAWMKKEMNKPEFCHEVMGPIVAQKIERDGKGLNLCHETLEAMMRHSGDMAKEGMTQEAWVIRYTDKFAYLFHDFNDIVERLKYPARQELREIASMFGSTQRERTTTAIAGLIIESSELGHVSFEQSELGRQFAQLRKFMYEIYPKVNEQKVGHILGPVLEFLTKLDLGDPFLILALMNDKDVINLSNEEMKDMYAFNQTAISEIVPYLSDIGTVDLCDPDLDW